MSAPSPIAGSALPSAIAGRMASVLLAIAVPACVGGVAPAECAIDADCGAGRFCAGTECIDGTRTCPTLQPTFTSINRNFIQVGCGVRQVNCHAANSAAVQSGPSFEGHPYATLVNAPAANRFGSARGLVLVQPGDPARSFLVTKLRLASSADPQFGSGQPATAPGSTCTAALAVIEQWIQRGAPDD